MVNKIAAMMSTNNFLIFLTAVWQKDKILNNISETFSVKHSLDHRKHRIYTIYFIRHPLGFAPRIEKIVLRKK
jgi:hypothetical protein